MCVCAGLGDWFSSLASPHRRFVVIFKKRGSLYGICFSHIIIRYTSEKKERIFRARTSVYLLGCLFMRKMYNIQELRLIVFSQ